MDQAEALLFRSTQLIKESLMAEDQKGKIFVYKVGPRGAAVRESDHQAMQTTVPNATRTRPSRPLRLQTNEAPETKSS